MAALGSSTRSAVRVAGILGGAVALVAALNMPAQADPTARTANHQAAATATAPAPTVIPKPASLVPGNGTFTLSRDAHISAPGGAAVIGRDLARYLRPATGYPLPVVAGNGAVSLRLVDRIPSLGSDPFGEAYQLDVTGQGVRAEAVTPHGLFDAVQTIRQLLPAQIDSPTPQQVDWTMPAVHIVDHPRYGYRGFMLDIARHYEPPAAVKQLLDRAAEYKINTFHLHLSDDQGFRIVIKGFPRLTRIGGQGSVGTDGRTMDPGGYWTQAQYKSVVAYAAARFITVIPEVDTPGHNNAIIMSEYNDTKNHRLNSHPQDINCGKYDPPMWDYTGDVGYSAMCPESDNTWTILTAIISQLTAMSPGPYYDLGGDEVPSTVLSQDRYAALVNRESGIVSGLGKTVMGWADIAGPGTEPPAGSVAEYWNPASGSSPGTVTATEAVAKNMKLVMAPANHAYLDQKYAPGVPANTGLSWACPNGCDVDQFYNWDPATYVDNIPPDSVIGVEGAMWGETVRNLGEVEYLVFPRLLAIAELGWSPQVERTADSPAYQDFLRRLGAQGPRFEASGTNYYPTPEVPWQ